MEQSSDFRLSEILEEFSAMYIRQRRRYSVCAIVLIILLAVLWTFFPGQDDMVFFVTYISCAVCVALLVFLFLGITFLRDKKKTKALKEELYEIEQYLLRIDSVAFTLSEEEQELLKVMLPSLYNLIQAAKNL